MAMLLLFSPIKGPYAIVSSAVSFSTLPSSEPPPFGQVNAGPLQVRCGYHEREVTAAGKTYLQIGTEISSQCLLGLEIIDGAGLHLERPRRVVAVRRRRRLRTLLLVVLWVRTEGDVLRCSDRWAGGARCNGVHVRRLEGVLGRRAAHGVGGCRIGRRL